MIINDWKSIEIGGLIGARKGSFLSSRPLPMIVGRRIAARNVKFLRWMCTTPNAEKANEPSEAVQPYLQQPHKIHQLFEVTKDDTKGQMQATAGGVIALGGVGLFAFNHQDLWLNFDFAAASLLLVGAAVAGSSSLVREATASNKPLGKKRFKFTLLNDDARLYPDLHSLQAFRPGTAELKRRLPAKGSGLYIRLSLPCIFCNSFLDFACIQWHPF